MTVLRDAVKNVYDLLRRRDDPVRVTLAHTLQGHTDWTTSVAFLPDGDHLFSGCHDGTVRKWRVSDGREVGGTMKHERTVMAIAVSPDGKLVASGGYDGRVLFWSTDTCEKVAEAQKFAGWITSLSFAPDSQTIANGSSDRSIALWNALTGERIAELFRRHEGGVTSVAFSPSGDKLAACRNFWEDVLIWDIHAGKATGPPIRLSGSVDVRSVIWSLDSRQLICAGGDGTINFLDSSNGTLLATCQGHTKWIWSMALSPDGTFLASASQEHTVRLWSTSTHQQLASVKHPNVNAVAISPDGRYLASGSSGYKLRIWHVDGVPSEEGKENPAASSTDLPSSRPQHVSSDHPQHPKSVEHPTTANDEANDDDQSESSVAGESARPNMTTANDSYLDLPAVLPPRPAVDNGVHTSLFDLGDPEEPQPNVTSDTRRGKWKKKAKESRQYLSQQIKHFREGMLPRHGASDVSGAARPSSSQKLKDRIRRIRRRTSLVPENTDRSAQDGGGEQSPNNKGKTPKLKPVLVAASRPRQLLFGVGPPRHVEQEKWYFVKRDGKLVRVPGPSTQPSAQGSSQLIAGPSNVASGGQAQGQSQQMSDDVDIDLCGCCAWVKR